MTKPKPERKKQVRSAEQEAKRREAANNAGREKAASVKEVGPIPPIVNPKRRATGGDDLEFFLSTYFPQSFKLEFSDDHRKVIRKIETSVNDGGLFALAMPRGSGKTTITIRAVLWALLYGKRRFAALIGASSDAANELLAELKIELETNDLLLEDFPEVCHPIRALEGEAKRAPGQMVGGVRTRIGYKGKQLIFPTVINSPSSGAIVRVAGLLGRIRGMKYTTADGESLRPDFLMIDDPQTDASARSENQCAMRERVLSGAILGLAGPGKRIAGVMPCTVIRKGDMADRILNRIIHPRWNGERCRLIYQWPTNQELWDTYAELRISDLRQGKDKLPQATEHYKQNFEAMNAGAMPGWPARYEPHELSAIQHAWNLKLSNPDTFDAEYQNDPKESLSNIATARAATAEAICQRASGYDCGEIPKSAQHLVCGVDVQGNVFFYVVLAVGQGFSSWVVDYGTWPDQQKSYFSLNEIDQTIQTVTGVGSLEGSLLAGLRRLETHLVTRSYRRDDGAPMPIERIVIDANWGPSTQTIYSFIRQSEQRTLWLPWHGKGIGAKQSPMSSWPRKPGEIVGDHWKITATQVKNQEPRHIIADTNYWKTFVHARLQQPDGEQGALMLYKASPMKHRMIADHIASEQPIETSGRGRELVEWQLLVGRDNHLFDSLCMAMVAGSTMGVKLREHEQLTTPSGSRKSLAQLREEALNRKKKR
jgi:hypothetical protein